MTKSNVKVRRSTVPYYGVAAVWAIYALLFDLYRASHFALVTVLSIVVFVILRLVCKDEVIEEVDSSERTFIPTGNEELDGVIRNGQAALSEMTEIKSRIDDPVLVRDISDMEDAAQRIFDHVREHPDKLPQIRRFLDYYIPTVLKLLKAYDSLSCAGISGKNINSAKERIAKTIGMVTEAFDNQLDKLFGSEAMDISSDIDVLKKILNQEGLLGDQLEAESTKDENGVNIDLQI